MNDQPAQGFANLILTRLQSFSFDDMDEQTIREEWIAPLLMLLGYGVTTLNEVIREPQVRLAKPFRKIGRDRLKIDYIPTVLGRNLWIIEAKSSTEVTDWDEHLLQAWGYATHPQVNVPLMVIADGRAIGVYDVNAVEWDEPIARIKRDQLAAEFSTLEDVLGARRIAGLVKQRLLGHLKTVMTVQLNYSALDDIVSDVRKLAQDAKTAVSENRNRVLSYERAKREEIDLRIREESGVWGLAQASNRPWGGVSKNQIVDLVDLIRSIPMTRRAAELDSFIDACRIGKAEKRPLRMFWTARALLLGASLLLRDDPACQDKGIGIVDRSITDHLLNFPDDELQRAAHRFGIALVPFVLRTTLAGIELPEIIRARETSLDDETLLRSPLSVDELLIRITSVGVTRAWFGFEPWTHEALNDAAENLERLVAELPFPRDKARGPAGDPFLDHWLRVDPLVETTLILVSSANPLPHVSEQVLERLRGMEIAKGTLVGDAVESILARASS